MSNLFDPIFFNIGQSVGTKKDFFKSNSKGGLASESFSIRLKSPNTGAKSQPWTLSIYRENAQDCDFVLFVKILAN